MILQPELAVPSLTCVRSISGSLVILGLLLLVGSPIVFGYAKPVPIDFSKLRGGFKGVAKTALAGPAANFILAIVAALAMCYLAGGPNSAWGQLLFLMAMINVVLMVFNLLPVPPLDGSKILAFLLPERWRYSYLASELGVLLYSLLHNVSRFNLLSVNG